MTHLANRYITGWKGKTMNKNEMITIIEIAEEQLRKAKDIITELQNELCLKCGNYKEEHLGKCDGCKWH